VLAVGVVTAYVSPDAQQGVRDANLRDGGNRVVPDFVRALEAGYQVRVGEHWQVTPGVQWVQHPGTTRETRNAVVAALRVTRD
jgi:carbohydrate-selective porin OprB